MRAPGVLFLPDHVVRGEGLGPRLRGAAVVDVGPLYPIPHPGDCECDRCKVDALTETDKEWLRAHGWEG